jgi:hypothetical protein
MAKISHRRLHYNRKLPTSGEENFPKFNQKFLDAVLQALYNYVSG